MKEISAVIIAKNEDQNIVDLIKNVSWAKEIIVIDDFSSDKTTSLAKELGAKVFKKKLTSFADQKNYGDSKASNDWILSIDADERVDDELKREILSLSEDNTRAYSITRRNMFLGHPMKSLDEKLIRLYDKSYSKWEGAVHESVRVDGETGHIKNGSMLHKSSSSIRSLLEKQNRYTNIEVERSLQLTKKQICFGLLFVPLKTFLSSYIKRGYFRDGLRGLVWSLYVSIYQINIYAKELEKLG